MFSNVMALVGPEGSGKTLGLTYWALLHHAQGGTIKTFPGYVVTDGRGNAISTELRMEEWLTFEESFRDILVCIDEIQTFFDAQSPGAMISRLFGYMVAQRRKRNLGIIYTTHDWMWVHNRIRADTHALGVCWDLYWSGWGKEEHLGRGEQIRINLFDVKGFFTGYPWSPGPSFRLNAKPIWEHYDTKQVVDIAAGFQRVRVKKQDIIWDARKGETHVYQYRPDEDGPPPPDGMSGDPNKDTELLNRMAEMPGMTTTMMTDMIRRLNGNR